MVMKLLSVLRLHSKDAWFLVAFGAFTLSALSPLVQVLGNSPEFFVAHLLTDAEIILFALSLSLVPLLVLYIIDLLWAISPLKNNNHVPLILITSCLLALFISNALNRVLNFSTILLAILYFILLVTLALVVVRSKPARDILKVTGALSVLLYGFFFLVSPVSALLQNEPLPDNKSYTTAADSKPLLFFIFDKFPLTLMLTKEGKIDDKRFPNFSYLSSNSMWFRNAKTVAPYTNNAVPAMLSGTLAGKEKRGTVKDYPLNIFTIFGQTHKVTAFESFTKLCPDAICNKKPIKQVVDWDIFKNDILILTLHSALPAKFSETFLPPMPQNWTNFGSVQEPFKEEIIDKNFSLKKLRTTGRDRPIIDNVLTRIRTLNDRELMYMHIENPHEPYKDLPGGFQRKHTNHLKNVVDHSVGWPENKTVSSDLHAFLLQAMYIDEVLGRIITEIKNSGYWDNSNLVVVSDHGASPVPGLKNRGFRKDQLADNMLVPLFIRSPDMKKSISDDSIYTVDILPTLLDLYRIQPDSSFSGVSLRSATSEFLALRSPVVQEGNGVHYSQSRLIPFRDSVLPDSSNPYVVGDFSELFGKSIEGADTIGSESSAFLTTIPHIIDKNYVSNTLHGVSNNLADEQLIAVALNGVISGFGYTYPVGDQVRFTVLVDPEKIVEENNTARIFQVNEGGDLREISRILTDIR